MMTQQVACEACRGHGVGSQYDPYAGWEPASCPVCQGDGWMVEFLDLDPNDLIKELCNEDV